ncbi:hypothetical protein L3X38_043461 [Prunus dulcis]|uniref:Reverse transcriptase Ty1/copia-type domain-containing protein n=1 Tax=Prunus dulcis TaxID=3755 RepID=A0AAD4UWR9_PRUDU|nr:hypothetical protein L3X38_043461 [Prunus dulcis]
MSDLGEANYVLGIKISREKDRKLIGLSQKAYIEKILKRFNMKNCTGCDVPFSKGDKLNSEQSPKTEQERIEMQDKPYASLVGSLMYAQRLIPMWNDNSVAIYFANGNKRSSGMRHLHLKFLSVKEKIQDGADVSNLQASVRSIFACGLAWAGASHGLPGLTFLHWRWNWSLGGACCHGRA